MDTLVALTLRKVNFMNIWHDIDNERVTPNDFLAVIEIS